MPSQATTAIFIDKYHPRADGLCAVSIRVTFDRKKRYYPTPVTLKPSDFIKVMGEKPRNEYKEISLRLQAFEKKAANVIDALPVFTWNAFDKHYLTNRGAKDSLYIAFTEYSKKLREAERIGTAITYECARESLFKFSKDARFADVTPEFLHKYEKWMLDNGNSITTVGMYLRNLRALFNANKISKELYPFGNEKDKLYSIRSGINIKQALTLDQIASIYYYKTVPGTTRDMAKDYWMFMYLCNGINVKDLCLLKYENIEEDIVQFNRAKTINTKKVLIPISFSLTEDAKSIIKKWGNRAIDKKSYIFPVLTKGITADRKRQLIQQITSLINDHMKEIAKDLNIKKLTTYVSRHSFATILQRSGASTEFISEALGHTDLKTTKNYLAGFEDETRKEKTKALTAFKNVKPLDKTA